MKLLSLHAAAAAALFGVPLLACPYGDLVSSSTVSTAPKPTTSSKPVSASDARAVLDALADQAPKLAAAARVQERLATRAAFLAVPDQAKGISDKVRNGQGVVTEAEAQWLKSLMSTAKSEMTLPREVQDRIAKMERKTEAGNRDWSRSDVMPIVELATKIAANQKKALSEQAEQKQLAVDQAAAGKDYPLLRMKIVAGQSPLLPHEKPQMERVLKLAEEGAFPDDKAVIAQIREAMNSNSVIPRQAWTSFNNKHWARFLQMSLPQRGPASGADTSAYFGPEADKMRAAIGAKLAKGTPLDAAETAWVRGASTVLYRDRRLDSAALQRLKE